MLWSIIAYNTDLTDSLLAFVVVGGGFSDIETVGKLNHFVKDAINEYYKNINPNKVRIIVINSENSIITVM